MALMKTLAELATENLIETPSDDALILATDNGKSGAIKKSKLVGGGSGLVVYKTTSTEYYKIDPYYHLLVDVDVDAFPEETLFALYINDIIDSGDNTTLNYQPNGYSLLLVRSKNGILYSLLALDKISYARNGLSSLSYDILIKSPMLCRIANSTTEFKYATTDDSGASITHVLKHPIIIIN